MTVKVPLQCDFCSLPDPTEMFQCRDFTVDYTMPVIKPDAVHEMIGEWLACVECAILINANDTEGLFQRIKESFIRRYHVWDDVANGQLKRLYEQFMENRIGQRSL